MELKKLFVNSASGLVLITAFLDRPVLTRHLAAIAWGAEAWIAEYADHMIDLNGQRFLGFY